MKFLLLLFFATFHTACGGVIAGPGCFGACFSACAMMGPGKFAAVVGIVFDIAGCAAMCGPVCACALPIPGICFSHNSTFLNDRNETLLVSKLKVGDHIMTMTQGALSSTQIVNISAIEGIFEFLNFHLVNSFDSTQINSLTVTDDHEVIVVAGSSENHIPAKLARTGQYMMGIDKKLWKVVTINRIEMPGMYILDTTAKTALSSELLTGTSCMHD